MGIPGLYGKWLSKYVRRAILGGIPPFIASLAFDLNGVFHEARKIVFGEGDQDPRLQQAIANTDPNLLELEVYNTVAGIILRMVQIVQPRDCLILAVDGVAPGAKMQQQRGRREKAARERSPIETFDRNAITPGTEFMIRLNTYIVRFIASYRQYLPPKIIYSSHLVPGEGEHKIMDYYRQGAVSDGPSAKAGAFHVLYGLDADLVMLSLLSPLENIVLSRETVEESVDINSLKQYILGYGKKPTSVDDFVVMMFLIGNDFLPHTPALEEMSESIVALMDIYATGNYVLTKVNENGRRSINWDGMKGFMREVTARENELLAALSTREVKYQSRFLNAALIEGNFYPEVFRSAWYQNALGAKGQRPFTDTLIQIIGTYVPTEQDYLINSGAAQKVITTISAVTPQRIETMAVDYMRMMEWVYLYYREGTNAINQDLAYPYYHTPMIVDLTAVMQTVGVTRQIYGYEAYEGMIAFNALQQLVAVLPMKSRELLPPELQPLFSYNSTIRDLFPENFIIELDGKQKEHQGVPIVPLIDRRRIIDAVATIPFSPERLRLWMPENEEIFVRTAVEAEILAQIQFDKQRHTDFLKRQADKAERAKARREGQRTRPQFQRHTQFPRQTQDPRQAQFPGQTQDPRQTRFPRQTQDPRQTRFPRRTQSPRQPQIPGQPQIPEQPLVPTMGQLQTRTTFGRGTTTQFGRGTRTGTRGGRGGTRGRDTRNTQGDIRRPPPQTPATTQIPTFTQTTEIPQITTQQPRGGQTFIQRPAPRQATGRGTVPTAPIGAVLKGPTLVPVGTTIPHGLQVGKGPTLVPVGTTIPVGLQLGKAAPKQVPTLPVTPQVFTAKQQVVQTTPVVPVTQVTTTRAKSPAQWKQLTNLM